VAFRDSVGVAIPLETPPEEFIEHAWTTVPDPIQLVNMVVGTRVGSWDKRFWLPVGLADLAIKLPMVSANSATFPAVALRAHPQGAVQIFSGDMEFTGTSNWVSLTSLVCSVLLLLQQAGCSWLYLVGGDMVVNNTVYMLRNLLCSLDLAAMAAANPAVTYKPERFHAAFLRKIPCDGGRRRMTVLLSGPGSVVMIGVPREEYAHNMARLLRPYLLQYAGKAPPRIQAPTKSRNRARRQVVPDAVATTPRGKRARE